MERTRVGRAFTAGLLLLLLASAPTLALDIDLEVKTAKATSFETVYYRVGTVEGSTAGEDAQTAVTLSLDGIEAGSYKLVSSFGQFGFNVDSNGAITVGSSTPMSVSGTTLTIQNTVDLEDFEFRMRNETSLSVVQYRLRHYAHGWGSHFLTAVLQIPGAEVDTATEVPLLGMVPGMGLDLGNNLGARILFQIQADGSLAASTANDIPMSFESAAPQTLVIENTVTFSGFGIRSDRKTSMVRIAYFIDDWYWGPGEFKATSGSTGPTYNGSPNVTTRTGSTAHSSTATYDMTGLAVNQLFMVTTSFGRRLFRVTSSGFTAEEVGDLPIKSTSGNVIVIDNWVDAQNFAVRTQNSVNADYLRWYPQTYAFAAIWVDFASGYPTTAGSQANQRYSFPLTGITPGFPVFVTGSIGSTYFRPNADGELEQYVPYEGYITEGWFDENSDGDITLVQPNPQELWIKVYARDALDASRPSNIHYSIGYSGGQFDGGSKWSEPEDFDEGQTFHLKYVGPHTRLGGGCVWYDVRYDEEGNSLGWLGQNFIIDLEPNGTGRFYTDYTRSVEVTVTGKLGAIPIVTGGVANILYIEIVDPPNAAPTVSLGSGGNLTISSSAQSSTTITASVADADGDDLDCSWYVDGLLVSGPSSHTNGQTALDLDDLDTLSEGSYVIRVEVSDGMFTATAELVLTVENSPPVVAVTGAGTYEVGSDVDVPLAGTVSDYDGDTVTWSWKTADGTVLKSGTLDTESGGEPVSIPTFDAATTELGVGVHTLSLVVEDEDNDPVVETVIVEVTDQTAPSLSPTVGTALLWPPNHKMVEVMVYANASDNSGSAVTLAVTVTSSEPAEFDGDGNFLPDHEVISIDQAKGEIKLKLRAERSGKGDGRVYTITITATDASGYVSVATIEVKAPHDKKKN